MSLAHAIMGLLEQEEMTGYDLKTSCFDRSIAHLWQADQAQIYRTLEKLEERGWISCTVEIQHDRPNRKIYRLTEAGKSELVGWLQSPQPLPTVRDPLLIQVFFAAQLTNDAIIHLLEKQLVARREKVAKCEAIELLPLGNPRASRDEVMQRLVLELVLQQERTYIDWLDMAIKTIRKQSLS